MPNLTDFDCTLSMARAKTQPKKAIRKILELAKALALMSAYLNPALSVGASGDAPLMTYFSATDSSAKWIEANCTWKAKNQFECKLLESSVKKDASGDCKMAFLVHTRTFKSSDGQIFTWRMSGSICSHLEELLVFERDPSANQWIRFSERSLKIADPSSEISQKCSPPSERVFSPVVGGKIKWPTGCSAIVFSIM